MRACKVTTESGHSWSTSINGTDESIKRYFMGQSFDVGNGFDPETGEPVEKMERVVKVEILPDDDPDEMGRCANCGRSIKMSKDYCPQCNAPVISPEAYYKKQKEKYQ